MSELLPEIPRSPAQLMHHSVDPGDVASAARPALRVEQLLQPLDAQQVQEVLLAVALDPPIRVCWDE